jgi:hypothetical protein
MVSPELDPSKNAANVANHGVSLSEADGVLLDPFALTIEDESAEGAVRDNRHELHEFTDGSRLGGARRPCAADFGTEGGAEGAKSL